MGVLLWIFMNFGDRAGMETFSLGFTCWKFNDLERFGKLTVEGFDWKMEIVVRQTPGYVRNDGFWWDFMFEEFKFSW